MTTTPIAIPKVKAINGAALFSMSRASLFVLLAGTILTFTGMGAISGGLAKDQLLDLADPIFSLSFRGLMLAFGTAEMLAAFLCLFTDMRTLSLGLVAWLSGNFMVYRIGLWSMGWHHSCGFLIDPLGLSLTTTDIIFSVSSTFLLVGSVATLWHERRTLQAVTFLKISCISCGGHIEFPTAAVGQKIQCPHCAKNITLLSPA
jgi:hypothetical protein